MSILEILEAHTGRTFDKDGMYVCQCGHYIGTNKGKAERHRAHVAQVLEQHEREAKAGAVRESARYLNHIMPNGLVNSIAVLADLDVAADRIGNGLHANGQDRKSP